MEFIIEQSLRDLAERNNLKEKAFRPDKSHRVSQNADHYILHNHILMQVKNQPKM